ncbi:DUF3857 domain-containing protein [Aureibacter tunicatorum]|uniref:Tetratricopeptide (TPR) repeat protein n=1 Tax=Aureibacter tunicatorum TaxID=866807 RepID=A0AAE3XMX7_9BACT|nr:DUF3857 domain-containing protein [Aureibacter tunicatorum]MDR6238711.1 tetratricopeptide (TPR) repeat protein [Aureibacter tunicatorum]BDD05358.1 hypothetical protein AUTU_28410 [Aureibacter tunicatorum]
MKKIYFMIFVLFAFLGTEMAKGQSLSPELDEALISNDLDKIEAALERQLHSGDHAQRSEANLMMLFLNTIKGVETDSEQHVRDFIKESKNPSPYIFALWKNEALIGEHKKRSKDELAFYKNLLGRQDIHPSIKKSLEYTQGTHHLLSNKFDQAFKKYDLVGGLRKWEYVGPFDNTSGSGFNKDYGPIEKPSKSEIFLSKKNSEIHWYEPKDQDRDPWMSIRSFIPVSQGVVYAQTFVESETDQKVVFALGGEGSLKLWVNDKLIITEEEEYKTEQDTYLSSFELKKGANRILVQIGATEEVNYPNFILRVLDENMNLIPNLTVNLRNRNYSKTIDLESKSIEHFAVEYFTGKKGFVNEIMLAKLYNRMSRYNDAIKVLKNIDEKYAETIIVKGELLLNHAEIEDYTTLTKEIEGFRKIYPDSYLVAAYDFERSMQNKDYEFAEKSLESIAKIEGYDGELYYQYKIRYLVAKKEYQKMYEIIDKAYKKHPDNTTFLFYTYNILKSTSQRGNYYLNFLTEYLDDNFNYNIFRFLVNEYDEHGMSKEKEKALLEMHKNFPLEETYTQALVKHYYNQKKYEKALDFTEKNLANRPFTSTYWKDKGYLLEQLYKNDEALASFEKAIKINPNLFDVRDKMRELNGKEALTSILKNEDYEQEVIDRLNAKTESDESAEYIFDRMDFVVFPEGAYVENYEVALQLFNQSAIEDWSEINIPVVWSRQNLVINKSEAIKANGQKTQAERSGGKLVFTSLEPGDAIYVSYRIENYTGGKLSKEFWMSHTFNTNLPTGISRLRLLTPKGYEFDSVYVNNSIQPEKSTLDEFDLYTWEVKNPEKIESESYTPSYFEIGQSLEISTIKEWKVISDWYRDIALPMAKEDYNIEEVYNEIFSHEKDMSEYEKAKAIYDYIAKNINYSSVSFRQSNYVPQKPLKTISTKLGDCKDLSTLYHTLAKKAGISTNLVLVNTRDNGEDVLKLPSLDFNHCIIKINLEGQTMYQELTDSKLPFGIVPYTLYKSQALVIPNSEDENVGNELISIPNPRLSEEKLQRKIKIQINGTGDIKINSHLQAFGNLSGNYRHYFDGMTKEKQKEDEAYLLGTHFENELNIISSDLANLEDYEKDVVWSSEYEVLDEIKNLGGIKALKVPMFEEFAYIDNFPDEKRKYPIVFGDFESVRNYDFEIEVNLPEGSEMLELPEGIEISNQFMKYVLNIEKVGANKVKITRTIESYDETFPASAYEEMRSSFVKINKAEDLYITFKVKKAN